MAECTTDERGFCANPPGCPNCGQPGTEMDHYGSPLHEWTCYRCGPYELLWDHEEWFYAPFHDQLIQRGMMDGEQRPSIMQHLEWEGKTGRWVEGR